MFTEEEASTAAGGTAAGAGVRAVSGGTGAVAVRTTISTETAARPATRVEGLLMVTLLY